MATTSTSEASHCSICLEIPKDPRRIPCLDVFCRVCLSELIEKNLGRSVFKCPNCRYEHQIPQMGADAFPVAYAPKRVKSSGRSVFNRPCPIHHTKKLRVFCSECEKLICIDCRNSLHIDHSTTTKLMDLVKERRRSVEWGSAELHENEKDLSSISVSLKKKAKALEVSKSKEIKAITNQATYLKSAIDSVANDLVITVHKKYANNQNSVTTKLRLIQEKKAETHKYISMADSIVTDTDVHRLLTDFQLLAHLKETILKTQISTDTDDIPTLFSKGKCKKKELQAMMGSVKSPSLNDSIYKEFSGPPLRPCSRYMVLPDIRAPSANNVSEETANTVTNETRPKTHR